MPEWGPNATFNVIHLFKLLWRVCHLTLHSTRPLALAEFSAVDCFSVLLAWPTVLRLQLWSLNTAEIHTAMVTEICSTVKMNAVPGISMKFHSIFVSQCRKKKNSLEKLSGNSSACALRPSESLARVAVLFCPEGIHSQVTELRTDELLHWV